MFVNNGNDCVAFIIYYCKNAEIAFHFVFINTQRFVNNNFAKVGEG